MILFELLRHGAEIDCRQCHREQCTTGQTLLAKLIFAVHDLSLLVDILMETGASVMQYALKNALKQM
jgi:hypothetical protein